MNRKAPASYTKAVVKFMTKAEMIIKVVMAPINPTFTEQFLKLLPDSSITEFQKLLDMKGVKRVDQTHLVEMFKRCAPKESLTSDSGFSLTGDFENLDSDKGRIKKLENLIKKRLPN